jgi:hypothetical protein
MMCVEREVASEQETNVVSKQERKKEQERMMIDSRINWKQKCRHLFPRNAPKLAFNQTVKKTQS